MNKLIHLPTHVKERECGAAQTQRAAERWHRKRETGGTGGAGPHVKGLSALRREGLNQREKLPSGEFWKDSACFYIHSDIALVVWKV